MHKHNGMEREVEHVAGNSRRDNPCYLVSNQCAELCAIEESELNMAGFGRSSQWSHDPS